MIWSPHKWPAHYAVGGSLNSRVSLTHDGSCLAQALTVGLNESKYKRIHISWKRIDMLKLGLFLCIRVTLPLGLAGSVCIHF